MSSVSITGPSSTKLLFKLASSLGSFPLDFVEGNGPNVNASVNGAKVSGSKTNVLRLLARSFPKTSLYGRNQDALTMTEVDRWLDFGSEMETGKLEDIIGKANDHLTLRTFFADYVPTMADIVVYCGLKAHKDWEPLMKSSEASKSNPLVHLIRWWDFVGHQGFVLKVLKELNLVAVEDKKAETASSNSKYGAQQNMFKYADLHLPGAEKGKVVTRFPPEPSGYLHIGHMKAALLNQYFAQAFEGKLIIRFDDTNPSKEKDEFVEAIIEDLANMGIVGDRITYTSDYFDELQRYAEQLIKQGDGYVDDSPAELIKEQRQHSIESPNRNNSVEKNLEMWKAMLAGTPEGQKCALRAKIDMKSLNGVLRDPALYRCVSTPHHRTGTKYKAYPLYDFAVPIVDSLEGVTHALRSSEYHDRNALYNWVCKTMKVRCPVIQDFSRLNFSYTLLSKRKLQWFVDKKYCDGWNDPRFPTVQGLLRRGLTKEALRGFILSIGASKSLNLMDMEKLWALNRVEIDDKIPRFTTIYDESKTLFVLTDGPETVEYKAVPRHVKNLSLGQRVLAYFKDILIEQADALSFKQGEEITLMHWGNAIVEKIEKDDKGKVTKVVGKLHLSGNFKDTEKKITWLANDPSNLIPVDLVEYGFLITKKKLEEDDKLEDFVNRDSKKVISAWGDLNMKTISKGESLQLERRGYYICDAAAFMEKKLTLLMIPDGHTVKQTSILTTKTETTTTTTAQPEKTEKK